MPALTFTKSAASDIIEAFGWVVADDPPDLIIDTDGEPVKSFHGHNITLGQFAGVVADENGDPVPLRDSFPDLVEYVAWKRENDRRDGDL